MIYKFLLEKTDNNLQIYIKTGGKHKEDKLYQLQFISVVTIDERLQKRTCIEDIESISLCKMEEKIEIF